MSARPRPAPLPLRRARRLAEAAAVAEPADPAATDLALAAWIAELPVDADLGGFEPLPGVSGSYDRWWSRDDTLALDLLDALVATGQVGAELATRVGESGMCWRCVLEHADGASVRAEGRTRAAAIALAVLRLALVHDDAEADVRACVGSPRATARA